MGSGASAPDFNLPNIGMGLSGIGGKDLEAYARNQLLNGLDPRQKAMLEGQASGSLRSGEQAQRERFASMGNVPVGAQIGAQTNLRSDVNRNLMDALLQGDIGAKQQGFQNWTQLGRMAMGISDTQNQYGLGKYQIDKSNEFNWGNALGGLLQAGGQAGSAAISKGA